MSLLKKASIITTPTAYAEDYLYSIKPAYALGSELITNGNFANGTTDWSSPDYNSTLSIVNGQMKIVNTISLGRVRQAVTTVVGKTYLASATVTNIDSSNGIQLKLSNSSNLDGAFFSSTNNTTTSPVTYTHKFTATATTTYIGSSQGSGVGQSGLLDDVSLKEVTEADFDFTRNSTGTRVNEDYLIEDVPYNLNTYSEDFDQWTKINVTVSSDQILAPDGTLSADKLIATSGASNKVIFQGITAGTYTASVFAKKGEFEGLFIGTGTVGAFFNLNTYAYRTHYTSPPTSYQIESYGNGWYRYSITFTESSNNNLYIGPNDNVSTTLAITGDGSKGIYIWGAQLVKGDQPKDYLKTTDRLDIPRIDYTNGEPSILLEPQRQNTITYSQDFSQWTVDGDASINSNNIISPEGIQNSDKLIAGTTSARQSIKLTSTNSGDLSFSIFAKKGEYSVIQLTDAQNASAFANFNLETGVVGSTGVYTASMVDMGNDWYRCIITWNASVAIVAVRVGIVTTPTSARVEQFAGNGSDGLYIYGAQLEAGSYATSLIHTSGSAVTRSADVANSAGNSDLINSTEGVLYIERKSIADDLTFKNISLSDGTTPNSIRIYTNNVSNSMVFLFFVSGVAQASYTHLFDDITEFHKVAFKYKANDFSVFVDGREVHTDTSGSVFSADTLNSLQFDSGAGGEDFYGDVKMVAVFKEALTDTELACLTGYNNHELYMNYYNRLSYLGLAEEYNVESDINNYIL